MFSVDGFCWLSFPFVLYACWCSWKLFWNLLALWLWTWFSPLLALMFCVGFVIGKVSVWRISLRCKCKSLQAFLIFRHLLVTYICLVHIVVFKSCLPDIAPKRKEYGTKKGFEENGDSSSDLLEVIATSEYVEHQRPYFILGLFRS